MNEVLTSLPLVPDWLNAISLDKFVPYIVESMMYAASGTYDFFAPLMTGLVWILITFFFLVWLTKQFIPQNWLDALGFKDGGAFYNDKISAKAMTERIIKMALRGVVATTILFAARPAAMTDVIINPFLMVGNMYVSAIVPNDANLPPAPPCTNEQTRGFMSVAACSNLANPLRAIIYKNNQVLTFGLDMMGVPSFITNTNPKSSEFDIGRLVFDLIVGGVLVITFFLSGLYIASLILQAIIGFCFEIILFPFRTFSYVLNAKDESWINPWPAFKGIVDSLRVLVVTMLVSGIMTIVNIIMLDTMFGGNEINANSWSDKFMLALSAVLSLIIMHKLFKTAQEKISQFGASKDDSLYKTITGTGLGLGGAGVRIIGNIGKMIKKK